jgi:Fe-S cluster assembly protein SufD
MGSTASRVNLHVNITHSMANVSVSESARCHENHLNIGDLQTNGAIIASRGQSLDIHSSITHSAPSSLSSQNQRNIIGDKGEGIFKGRIRIPKIAQLTSSTQLCRSLLIGESAHIVAMPTLEVTADNVECSHGASVSDLDDNSLFYFSSRGIDRKVMIEFSLHSYGVSSSLCLCINSMLDKC